MSNRVNVVTRFDRFMWLDNYDGGRGGLDIWAAIDYSIRQTYSIPKER